MLMSASKLSTDPGPDSEFKIWRLTGFGAGFEVLVFGSDPVSESIFLTPPIFDGQQRWAELQKLTKDGRSQKN